MNMVERVARAIAAADAVAEGLEPNVHYRLLARAAIEAMREPTDDMAEKGEEAAKMLAERDDYSAVFTWRVMITAALTCAESTEGK